jgi:hypothetical protein
MKEELVDVIIDDLRANLYDSQEYIFELVKEALMQRTIEDLKEINP